MEIHWVYEGCDEADEARVERYWSDRWQMDLEAKLGSLSLQPDELQMFVEQQEESPHWLVQAALHLPTSTVAAEARKPRVEEALDKVCGQLCRGAEQEDEQQANQPAFQRRRALEAVVPLLQQSRASNRSDSFFFFLEPLLETYRSYAHQMLELRELEDDLPPEMTTTSDVLDETLVRAWERFASRDPQTPLDLWLMQMIRDILDDQTRVIAQQSLEDRSPEPQDEPQLQESFQDQWTEHADFPETIELGELLPGRPGIDTWDRLDMESKQVKMNDMLGRLSRDQQHALILTTVEGYNLAEAADILDKSPDAVATDIATAREVLERYFLQETLPQLEEQLEQADIHDERLRRHR